MIEDAFKGVVAAREAGCACIAIPNDLTRDNDFGLADAVLEHAARAPDERHVPGVDERREPRQRSRESALQGAPHTLVERTSSAPAAVS